MGDPDHLLGHGHLHSAHLHDGELQGQLLLLDVPSGEVEEEWHVPDGVVASDGLGLLGVNDMAVVVKVDDDIVAWKRRQSLGERDLFWTHTREGGWRFVSQVPEEHGQPNWGAWGATRSLWDSVELWEEDGDMLSILVAPTLPWLGTRTSKVLGSHPCLHPRLYTG